MFLKLWGVLNSYRILKGTTGGDNAFAKIEFEHSLNEKRLRGARKFASDA
jgi:hypothetical protein